MGHSDNSGIHAVWPVAVGGFGGAAIAVAMTSMTGFVIATLVFLIGLGITMYRAAQ